MEINIDTLALVRKFNRLADETSKLQIEAMKLADKYAEQKDTNNNFACLFALYCFAKYSKESYADIMEGSPIVANEEILEKHYIKMNKERDETN